MIVGEKVVCINDRFPVGIERFYDALPKAGVIYIVREVKIGVNWTGEAGEVCVYLVGLKNPKSSKPPFPERGFNSERFRTLEEMQEENKRLHPEQIAA